MKLSGSEPETQYTESMVVTPIGEKCTAEEQSSKSLSDGAIDGIVVACIFAAVAIVATCLWCKKCKEPSLEQDPLNTEFLSNSYYVDVSA